MSKIRPLALAISLALPAAAMAEESIFHFSGFGTVGVVQTDTNDAQYRNGLRQPEGADKSASLDVDSKLGLQVVGKFHPRFSATAQVLVQPDEEGDYKPELEWAFAKFDLTPDLSLRGGRIGAPIFLISDFRNVGYANPWARPPVDVYAQVPLSTFDGVDLVWRQAVGDNTLTVQPFVGQTDFDLAFDLEGEAKKMVGVNATYEIGSLLLRAGYTQIDLTVTSPSLKTLFGGMRTVGLVDPRWSAAADALEAKEKKSSFTGVGATWDDGQLLVQGEYTQRRTESYVEDTNAWYGTVGYRFGNFMPYVSYASIETQHDDTADKLAIPAGPAPITGAATVLKPAMMSAMSGIDQSTTSIGVRWNAYKNIALKAQFDRVKNEAGKDNWFTTPTGKPGVAGKTVNVYSLVADFVF